MSLLPPWRRHRPTPGTESARAAAFDEALDALQRGDAPLDAGLVDEVAMAARLAACAGPGPAPHEPLVALRAALAARSARDLSPWRRWAAAPFRLAATGVVAAAAALAVLATGAVENPLGPAGTAIVGVHEQAQEQAQEFLLLSQENVAEVRAALAAGDSRRAQAAAQQAAAAASSARALVEAALPPDSPEREQVSDRSRKLLGQVEALVPAVGTLVTTTTSLPTSTSSTSTSSTSTSSTTSTSTTSTTVPPTTTTTAPHATTTTAPPTTSTTAVKVPPGRPAPSTTTTTIAATTTTRPDDTGSGTVWPTA